MVNSKLNCSLLVFMKDGLWIARGEIGIYTLDSVLLYFLFLFRLFYCFHLSFVYTFIVQRQSHFKHQYNLFALAVYTGKFIHGVNIGAVLS